jgi:K+-sensing histidine kinase KdpD
MSALVDRVLDEMRPFVTDDTFNAQVSDGVSVLGDEALMEQALWSLFTCASALSAGGPVYVSFSAKEWHAVLIVTTDSNASLPDIEDLFRPLRSIEYETGSSLRLTTGLYLCREIVRVHNGRLQVESSIPRVARFVLEIPV